MSYHNYDQPQEPPPSGVPPQIYGSYSRHPPVSPRQSLPGNNYFPQSYPAAGSYHHQPQQPPNKAQGYRYPDPSYIYEDNSLSPGQEERTGSYHHQLQPRPPPYGASLPPRYESSHQHNPLQPPALGAPPVQEQPPSARYHPPLQRYPSPHRDDHDEPPPVAHPVHLEHGNPPIAPFAQPRSSPPPQSQSVPTPYTASTRYPSLQGDDDELITTGPKISVASYTPPTRQPTMQPQPPLAPPTPALPPSSRAYPTMQEHPAQPPQPRPSPYDHPPAPHSPPIAPSVQPRPSPPPSSPAAVPAPNPYSTTYTSPRGDDENKTSDPDTYAPPTRQPNMPQPPLAPRTPALQPIPPSSRAYQPSMQVRSPQPQQPRSPPTPPEGYPIRAPNTATRLAPQPSPPPRPGRSGSSGCCCTVL